jgi:hypothetical protein
MAKRLQEELAKLEYRVNQDFDRSLSKFTKQVTQFIGQLTEQKSRWLF